MLLHVTAGHQSKNVGTVRFCKTQRCWNFTLPSLQLPLLHRTWLENVSSKIPGLVAFNKTWKYPDVSSKEFVFATNLDENFPTSLQKYPVFLPLTQCRNYTKIFLKSAFVVVPTWKVENFDMKRMKCADLNRRVFCRRVRCQHVIWRLCRLLLDATTYLHLSRGQFYDRGRLRVTAWSRLVFEMQQRLFLEYVSPWLLAEDHHWTIESCSHVKILLVDAAKSSLTSNLSRDDRPRHSSGYSFLSSLNI